MWPRQSLNLTTGTGSSFYNCGLQDLNPFRFFVKMFFLEKLKTLWICQFLTYKLNISRQAKPWVSALTEFFSQVQVAIFMAKKGHRHRNLGVQKGHF
jgi:hypothetical protein